MVNETLQDIFDDFYAREARLEEDREKRRLIEENNMLLAEIEERENDIYDRNDTIDAMRDEITRAQYAFEDCVNTIDNIKKTLEILEEGRLKDLKWHLDHAKIDW